MAGTPHSGKNEEKISGVVGLTPSDCVDTNERGRRPGCYQPGQQQKWRDLQQGQYACWQGLGNHRGGVDVAHLEEISEGNRSKKMSLGSGEEQQLVGDMAGGP